jgi:hypothetical protein
MRVRKGLPPGHPNQGDLASGNSGVIMNRPSHTEGWSTSSNFGVLNNRSITNSANGTLSCLFGDSHERWQLAECEDGPRSSQSIISTSSDIDHDELPSSAIHCMHCFHAEPQRIVVIHCVEVMPKKV